MYVEEVLIYNTFLKLRLVEVNYCRIIPHYCNNKFALQYADIHNLCPDSKHT
jgi:hypothetical protein